MKELKKNPQKTEIIMERNQICDAIKLSSSRRSFPNVAD